MSSSLRTMLSGVASDVAPHLLGWVLISESADGAVAVELTEVEAYDGGSDPASHAFRGKTTRNATLFGPAGYLYVYRIHQSWCCNVVTGTTGHAFGVLLRAGRVVTGMDVARARRGGGQRPDASLARGPGNLAKVLAISGDHDGIDLLTGEAVRLRRGHAPDSISSGPRTNVSKAAERPLRFWVTGDPTVSPFKPFRR